MCDTLNPLLGGLMFPERQESLPINQFNPNGSCIAIQSSGPGQSLGPFYSPHSNILEMKATFSTCDIFAVLFFFFLSSGFLNIFLLLIILLFVAPSIPPNCNGCHGLPVHTRGPYVYRQKCLLKSSQFPGHAG